MTSLLNVIKAFEEMKYKRLIVAVFSTALVLLYLQLMDNRTYPFDSGYYFSLAESLKGDNGFSLLHYPLSMRGIIFPLILYPFNRISEFIWATPLFGWRLLISLLSGLFTVAFPAIFKGLGRDSSLPLPLMALIFVWSGLFLSPLADLIAIFFMIYALALIRIGYDKFSGIVSWKEILQTLPLFCLSGVLLYFAYNTRTIYLAASIGVIAILLNFLVTTNHQTKPKRIGLLAAGAILIGVLLGAVPQGISNLHTQGSYSIDVPTHLVGESGLNLFQLNTGLKMNLYETSMVEGERADFSYQNRSGTLILERRGEPQSISEYISLALLYPLEFIGSYMRSLIALLNPISGGGYIYQRSNMRFVYTVLNYTILFLTLGFLKRRYIDISLANMKSLIKSLSTGQKTSLISLGTMLLPFVAILPGAVEERFAIPFWLVIYGILFYCIKFKEEIKVYKNKLFSSIVVYSIGFAFFIAILTEIYANNTAEILLPILYMNY